MSQYKPKIQQIIYCKIRRLLAHKQTCVFIIEQPDPVWFRFEQSLFEVCRTVEDLQHSSRMPRKKMASYRLS